MYSVDKYSFSSWRFPFSYNVWTTPMLSLSVCVKSSWVAYQDIQGLRFSMGIAWLGLGSAPSCPTPHLVGRRLSFLRISCSTATSCSSALRAIWCCSWVVLKCCSWIAVIQRLIPKEPGHLGPRGRRTCSWQRYLWCQAFQAKLSPVRWNSDSVPWWCQWQTVLLQGGLR